ncbi:MAG: rod shape-determining protein [Brevinematales bacterium]|nr:rod shape-determining protein [Brevinematales bacterium]
MAILGRVLDAFTNEVGVDLGTANTLIYVKGKGIVLSEPSVVSIETKTGNVIAVGYEAKRMLERTPGEIMAIRPMKDGVIADFEAVGKMLKYFLLKAQDKKLIKPTVVIGVPSGVTEVERRAVREAAELAGAAKIYLVEQSLAAAIGAELPISEPYGHMVIDIGGGTTEIAVISLGGIVVSKSIKVGGDKFDEAIVHYLKKNHNLLIGETIAEEIKKTIGSASPLQEVLTMEVKGRDTITGLPKTIKVDSTEIREALQPPLQEILDAVKQVLDETPAALSADLVDRGIVLTGGGALLKGMDKFFQHHMKIPVIVASNPMACVAIGTGKYLEFLRKNKIGQIV